ncbi:MAG TPA: NAD-dependent epimerase/dehydratase family protein [Chryseolinea sp.]|nr:NAD-dependent epimerase/dehydratase family protein [Chryseolinea sp.]
MTISGKKVLVLGGTGFLGNRLIHQLLQSGCEVSSFSRTIPLSNNNLKVNFICGDIQDFNAVRNACEGNEIIFLTTARTGFWGSWKDYYNTNYLGTKNVIDACLNLNIKYLIYTSTPSVAYSALEDIIYKDESIGYANTFLSPYPETKALAEKLILKSNGAALKTVALRPHIIWGIGDRHIIPRILKAAKNKTLRRIGNRDIYVDITNVENAAAAHIQVANALINPDLRVAGKAYFISDDKPVELWTWVNEVLKEIDYPLVKDTISFPAAYNVGLLSEYIYKAIPFLREPRLTRFTVSQLAHSHHFNIGAAKNDFGYHPIKNPDEAFIEYIDHLKSSLD